MKSIRMKIVACMLIAILTSLVIVGGISAWLNYTSTIDTLGPRWLTRLRNVLKRN